jgi:hypothetical protein
MTRSDGRPAWIAEGQAWVNAKLDERIDAFNRKLANDAIALAAHTGDTKASKRLSPLSFGGFIAKELKWQLELALRQAMQGNIEPLRREMQKEDPRLAQFINLPRLKGRGRHFEKPPHPARDRLENALEELRDARFFLQSFYKKTGRPRGQLTAKQILAERWDLTENEIRKRCISHSRLKREQSTNVRPK